MTLKLQQFLNVPLFSRFSWNPRMPSLREFLLPWGVLLVPSPFSSLSPSVPGSYHPTFCLYEFSCPGHFVQMNHTISDLLCLAFLSTNVFKFPLYGNMDQYVIPFHCWILFLCMDMPLLFIHSSVAGQLSCFYLLLLWLMQVCIFVYKFCLDRHFPFSSVYT